MFSVLIGKAAGHDCLPEWWIYRFPIICYLHNISIYIYISYLSLEFCWSKTQKPYICFSGYTKFTYRYQTSRAKSMIYRLDHFPEIPTWILHVFFSWRLNGLPDAYRRSAVRRCAASPKWILTGPRNKSFNFLEFSGAQGTAMGWWDADARRMAGRYVRSKLGLQRREELANYMDVYDVI